MARKSKSSKTPTDPADGHLNDSPNQNPSWSPAVRAIISFVIILHLVAVIIAPLSMMMPTANLIEPLRQKLEPYHQAAYLGHGYQFFAPDPGPSHFVQYTATEENGDVIKGRFPDRDQHWPRLYYHRWFMLSERVYELNSRLMTDKDFATMMENMNRDIAAAKKNGDNRAMENLIRSQKAARETHVLIRSQSDRLTLAIENEIKRCHGAVEVEITCVERILPAPFEISQDQRNLDDEIYLPVDRKIKLGKSFNAPTHAEEIR